MVFLFALKLLAKENVVSVPGHCGTVSLKVVFSLKLRDSSSNVSPINFDIRSVNKNRKTSSPQIYYKEPETDLLVTSKHYKI